MRTTRALILGIAGILAVISFNMPYVPASGNYSLRFFGNGVNDIDRVKIQIDPHVPADVGATDFTLEFWMKANPGDNSSNAVSCNTNDGWITGNIIFDRDIWGPGDYGISGFHSQGARSPSASATAAAATPSAETSSLLTGNGIM
jgi:hypothetical protein